MTVHLTDRELATVLLALSYWQQDLAEHEDEETLSAHHFDPTTMPLSVEEIDRLCERLIRDHPSGPPVCSHLLLPHRNPFMIPNLTTSNSGLQQCGPFPEVAAFVQRHGRLPKLGDDPSPWHYRGWLLPYIIQLHAVCPAVADRWGYHLRTLEAGKLLDEPIPQITFGPPNDKVFSLLHEWSRLVSWDCGGWSDFRTLIDWLCWALSLSREKPRLSDEVHEKLYRQVNLVPLLERPFDYLGQHVVLSKAKGWNPTGFYPTPHPVVECMVRLMLHDAGKDGRDTRTFRVGNPCVGSGRMLLHASNISLPLFGQDIDPLAVAMCKINGVLYAPWMSFPLPAAIVDHERAAPATPLAPEEAPDFHVDDLGQGLLFGA